MKPKLQFYQNLKFRSICFMILFVLSFGSIRAVAQTATGDSTAAQFAEGSHLNTYISEQAGGEVMLQPQRAAEFTTAPPVDQWNQFLWQGNGSVNYANGSILVDGARFNTEPESLTFATSTTVEFVATFAAAPFQHIGFGAGSDATGDGGIFWGEHSWAMFSTGNNGVLQARLFDGTTNSDYEIPGTYSGEPHLYRINWTSSSTFDFYIDGELVYTSSALEITEPMRVAISDYNTESPVSVDWIHVLPYATSGTFESRILTASGKYNAWGIASWNADVPENTALVISVRTGNSPVPDKNWTEYTVISNGDDVPDASKYLQYKAEFSTNDPGLSPVLQDFSIGDVAGCKLKAAVASQTDVSCFGANDGSITIMTRKGVEPIQYKLGQNGTYQSEPTFAGLRPKAYAIFVRDATGCMAKVSVTVTGPTEIVATVSEQTDVSCQGGRDGSVTLSATGGNPPYKYRKRNGEFVDDPVFGHLKAGDYNFRVMDVSGCLSRPIKVTITEPETPCLTASDESKLKTTDLTVTVSPNPTAGDFRLKISGASQEDIRIVVTDMYGRTVYKSSGLVSNGYRFGNDFPKGLYVLQVSQGKKTKTIKLVKQ